MVAALLLAAQLLATGTDSIYASAALREFVSRASERNRQVPDGLTAYRANLESEIAIVARRPDGNEATISVEQVRNVASWRRTGDFEQHVVGYRSQQIGLTMSMVGLFGRAWAVPILYGNRLSLLFDSDTGAPPAGRRRRTVIAIHPFSADRERAYRFSGGDTIATIESGARRIPVVRVMVEPRRALAGPPTLLFRGEVDVDADRGEIVRMRGYFVTVNRRPTLRERMVLLPLTAVAFVELENAEIEGRYWLPSHQRIEAQGAFAGNGEQRSAVRVMTRFREYRLNGASGVATVAFLDSIARDSIAPRPHRLTFAAKDSLDRAQPWARPLGRETSEAHVDDFGDIAPDAWRSTGPPRLAFGAPRLSDFTHYDRIEGAYTGLAGELRLRDRLPGATIRANAGWAWSEQTLRGRLEGEWRRGAWEPSIRVGRTLDVTNDFLTTFDSTGNSLDALLFSIDDRDYVDRRRATVAVSRLFGARGASESRTASVRLEFGAVHDGDVQAALDRGPFFRPDSLFRPNRGVTSGSYAMTALTFELEPDVNAEFVRPGFGAKLRYERADGQLDYQRFEGRLVARENRGPATIAARLDAGMLVSDDPPPQQLFELGRGQRLPGYGYKEFAGDRAAVLRGLAMWRLPLWRSPIHVWRRWWLPSPSPAIAFGAQSGWTEASDSTARLAIARLGSTEDVVGRPPLPIGAGTPVSRPTDGIRSSVDLGFRFFGGSTILGMTRAVDHRAHWKWLIGFAQGL